ncbi:hypothetical protein BSNK01_12410 [Bacillaceae bacterium]
MSDTNALEIYSEIVSNHFFHLNERVQEEIDDILIETASWLIIKALRCESPIEQLLYLRLLKSINLDRKAMDYKVYDPQSYFRIYPQYKVIVGDKTYRLDFHLECHFKGRKHLFAIECDGHEFHEKSKEQAARDKQRDRDLASLGYVVLRFTGSEIWKDPSKCADQVLDIIDKLTGYKEEVKKEFAPIVNRLNGENGGDDR